MSERARPITDTRFCLKCNKDLTDVMGCYIFASGVPVPDDLLFCVTCGNNGANGISVADLKRYIAQARVIGHRVGHFRLTVEYTF